MKTLPIRSLADVTPPAAAIPVLGALADQTRLSQVSGSSTIRTSSKNDGPRSSVVRCHVSVATAMKPGFVPIALTMDRSGRALEHRYAYALHTLSDWCADFLERFQENNLTRMLMHEIAFIAHDLSHLYYDPQADWWVYIPPTPVSATAAAHPATA
jgi:hypothetical protein